MLRSRIAYFLILAGLLAGILSCRPGEKREIKIPPLPASPQVVQEASILALNDAIDEDPNRSEYYYRRAVLYRQTGKSDLALEDINRAIQFRQTDERYGRYYVLQSEMYLAQHKSDSAYLSAMQAVKLDVQSPEFSQVLGQVYAVKGQYSKALASLDEALRRSPADPQLHYWKGHALAGAGDTTQALNYLNEAIRLRPAYKQAYNRLTEIYLGAWNLPQAKQYGLKGLKIDSNYVPLTLNLAKLYLRSNRSDSAKYYYSRALQINPNQPEVSYDLANLYFWSNQFWLALPIYEKLLSRRDKWPDIPSKLFTAYEKTGRSRQALVQYRTMVETDSTNVAANEVYQLLKKKDDQRREWKTQDSLQRRRRAIFNIETIPVEIKE